MFRLLVEGSGKVMGDQEVIEETSSNLPVLIDRYLEKLKEQTSPSVETPFVDAELFEKYQKDLELMLCKEILEEDMLVWSQLNDLSNQFRVTSQELFSLKEEKDVLQKDLERSEEKAGLVREKLTMAVKKGKGLVQDRDNVKILLEERKSEIEKLRLEIQQEESRVAECRDQISTLSADLERVPKLESNLVAMKEERDQLEKFLTESNSILQRVVESIDRIVIPVDSKFLEPVEKLDLLARYIDDCQTANTQAEQELMEVKEESSNLAGKLAQAQETMKLLEDALAVKIEEARLLEETCDARKSLEEALSQAENRTSVLITDKEDVQGNKAASEMELEKMREEIAIQTSRLAKAYNTITTLENALSLAEKPVASLTEQYNNAQLKDAGITIKSLDNALAKAENDFSALLDEKRTADQEVSTLNSKLNVCMEELAGSSGNLAADQWS
ncbi:centrosomal protein of 135 kDa-like protein isoform X3 [Gossypium australe]|uniref:Centrosomal protein of 135 kDa-like protein isoform X3 n=1 Tax=Gossypium australe TaxID=47621 RepID=A0A5B6V925_9ROSI|nr:centrosomal protein of 135 kDa-like protein isoform X3 [Gossypium australe]